MKTVYTVKRYNTRHGIQWIFTVKDYDGNTLAEYSYMAPTKKEAEMMFRETREKLEAAISRA